MNVNPEEENRLVSLFINLARWYTAQYKSYSHIDQAALFSAAMEGVWKAVRKHNGAKASLSYYVTKQIKFHIFDYIRNACGRMNKDGNIRGFKKRGLHLERVELNQEIGQDGETIADLVKDEHAAEPDKETQQRDLMNWLVASKDRGYLTPLQFDTLYAYFFLGKNFTELAKEEGLTLAAISSRTRLALHKLRKISNALC